ncbi:siderophore-interacting protein [Zhihengliuella flava]|uniref:NADPH-dependent ferric siderophore reductase n=1 Tax=Zhihengliuella flava TaxID=1285193 RepID=A0A931DCY5_9MICC|nr:siderophore-interacting protein [Zhihengliuella flava]MBG6085276.1 NADPH-dependent ferric siderophore reductase [Zhihengliuella flava]
MADARPARGRKPQVVLEVLATRRLNDHFVRLTLGGQGFAQFQSKPATDQYVKILFADPALGLEPPYDMEELATTLPPEQMPVRRTYTVRRVDHEAGTLDIDFVYHGEEGLAGPWAAQAQVGDVVCFAGPGGLYEPDAEADWHLLVGDEAALPAIAAALEAMDADARGEAYLEVAGPADQIDLVAPSGINVHWLHRGGDFTPETTGLVDAVVAGVWHEGRVQVFAHGERESMKALRAYLCDERGVARKGLSLSAYWAYGRAEDDFQAEKRQPVGQIFPEDAPATS